MTKALRYALAVFLVLWTPALAGDDHEHGTDSDHEHNTPADANDHGHGGETPSVAVTQWTDEMELFMEYPILVAKQDGRFIIHLTILDGFKPVRDGTVTLRFRAMDGTEHEVVSTELLREGVFSPAVRLPRPGGYIFELSYDGPEASSDFRISDFDVYARADAIPADAEEESGDEIAFLKEQQWKIPFETSEAEEREIKRAVWAIGEVRPAPKAYIEIVAPIDGVVQAGGSTELALPGSPVRRGDVVATIAPALNGDGWAASQLAFAQAERNLERARRLLEKEAISEREFEEATNEYLARKAGHDRLAGTGDGGVLKLTAPIDGKIVDWQVRPGQHLAAGDRLMAIVDPSVVWLEVNVYDRDFEGLGTPVGAFIGGHATGWTIPEEDMRVLTTGGALDPVTRTIPVLLEVMNTDGRLKINESSPVELYASDGVTSTAIPRSAVYKDDGMNVVFVQLSGESFAKRVVKVGPTYANWISILDGLHPGDRVVAKGGYHVKLASTSAVIGHGHSH